MLFSELDEEILEKCIQKARQVEGAIKKFTVKARLEKLTLEENCKKAARESAEMLAIKGKYKVLRKDVYEKRKKFIESIPHFWRTACLNCSLLRENLSEEDVKIIKFLKSVVVQDWQNDNRAITFLFDMNTYFENTHLTIMYSCTYEGILYKQGTKILWKSEIPGNKSFFTLLFDPKDKDLQRCDELIKAIEERLWPRAFGYFSKWSGIGEMEVEEGDQGRIALCELNILHDRLEQYDCKEYRECMELEQKLTEKALEEQVHIERNCNQERRLLYLERNEIVKAIPKFWFLAFYSHYALGALLGVEDQKIFRVVDFVDVVDDEDVTSGYTITLNFNENPYFTDTSLTKRISFCKDGTTELSAVKINWKVHMDIPTKYQHETPLTNASFFTWFCAPQVMREGYRDEVSELIKDELWPNAVAYFVNRNESDEEDE